MALHVHLALKTLTKAQTHIGQRAGVGGGGDADAQTNAYRLLEITHRLQAPTEMAEAATGKGESAAKGRRAE